MIGSARTIAVRSEQVTYETNQAGRMACDRYRARGLDIGNGIVRERLLTERACKSMKDSGTTIKVEGSSQTIVVSSSRGVSTIERGIGMNVELEPLMEATLKSVSPYWELHGVVRALLAVGYPRADIEKELIAFVERLRANGRDSEEEPIVDVYNDMVGWCTHHTRL